VCLRRCNFRCRNTGSQPAALRIAPTKSSQPRGSWFRGAERRHPLFALERAEGNRKRAAEWLGVTRRMLYRMAARHGIKLSDSQN